MQFQNGVKQVEITDGSLKTPSMIEVVDRHTSPFTAEAAVQQPPKVSIMTVQIRVSIRWF